MAVERKRGRWMSKVRFDGEMVYIGMFDTEEEARDASNREVGRIREGTSDLNLLKETISLREYSAKLQVRLGTLRRWIHEGMPAKSVAGLSRIVADEADAWVRANRADTVAFARSSFIYVAKRSVDGAVKIGWTSDVERRLRELRKEGDPVVFVAALPGDKPVELRIHAKFAPHRIDGEWFRISAEEAVAALREAA